MTTTQLTATTEATRTDETAVDARSGCRVGGRRLSALLLALALAVPFTTAATSVAGAATGGARAASVTCSDAKGTIEVTPRLVGEFEGQWGARRIWFARWDGQRWVWQNPTAWSVERLHSGQNPMGAPIDRMATVSFQASGYYYVYTQYALWNANSQAWYGGTGSYTTTYEQFEPSVSHLPDSRSQAQYCTA